MYCSYLFLYQSSDYVVCMIRKNVYTESTNTFICKLPYCSKCLN